MSNGGDFQFEELEFEGEAGFGEEAEAGRFRRSAGPRRFVPRGVRARPRTVKPARTKPKPARPPFPGPVRRRRRRTPFPAVWMPWPVVTGPGYFPAAPDDAPPAMEPPAEPDPPEDGGIGGDPNGEPDGGPEGSDAAPEEEIKVLSSVTVTLRRKRPIMLRDTRCMELPAKAGIYVIRSPAGCYVGKALDVRHRFQARMKTFTDFGFSAQTVADLLKSVSIDWYELEPGIGALPFTANRRGAKERTWRRIRWSSVRQKTEYLLRVLEYWFIRQYTKCRNEPGERVCFETGAGGLAISIADEATGRTERHTVTTPADCRAAGGP